MSIAWGYWSYKLKRQKCKIHLSCKESSYCSHFWVSIGAFLGYAECKQNSWGKLILKENCKAENLLSVTWKGGGIWSVSTERKGGEKESEREWDERLGGCVSVWVRDREKEEGCRQRERERKNSSSLSDLSCGEDTQLKRIPEAASDEKGSRAERRRSRDILSISSWPRLTASDLRWTHTLLTHALTRCFAHQLHNRLCCSVRSKGFPRVRQRKKKADRGNLNQLKRRKGTTVSLSFWWV